MILYFDIVKDKTFYRNRNGFEFDPSKGGHTIYIPLKFCKVFSIDVPPVPPKELVFLVENRLPTLFPGNLEGMEWDFRSRSQNCLVFIMEKELLHRVQQETGKSLLLSSALFLPENPEHSIYSFETADYTDLFFLKDGQLDHALSLPLKDREQIPDLCKDFLKDPLSPEKLIHRDGLAGLFTKNKGAIPHKKTRKILLSLLLIPLIVSIIYPLITLKNKKDSLKILQEEIAVYQNQERNLTRGNSLGKEDIDEISSLVPVDVYALFIELKEILSGKGRITAFRMQGKEIQIELRCRDGLTLTEQLKGLENWKSFELEKIQRDDDGWEQILWTGELP